MTRPTTNLQQELEELRATREAATREAVMVCVALQQIIKATERKELRETKPSDSQFLEACGITTKETGL